MHIRISSSASSPHNSDTNSLSDTRHVTLPSFKENLIEYLQNLINTSFEKKINNMRLWSVCKQWVDIGNMQDEPKSLEVKGFCKSVQNGPKFNSLMCSQYPTSILC